MNLGKLFKLSILVVMVVLVSGHVLGPISIKAVIASRSAVGRMVALINSAELAAASGSTGALTASPAALPTTEPAAAATPPEDAQASSKAAASSFAAEYASLPRATASARPRRIGVFVNDSPIDQTSLQRIESYASLGVDTVFNYSILDGSPADITGYLNKAQSRGIQVIFSLKDLYDQLGPNNYRTLYTYPLGDSNQSAAVNAVQQFGAHPAVWGFAINDERPESPADLGLWQPIMQQRYSLIKQHTTKPVMQVLVGATSPSAAARAQFLRSLRSSTDTFALDYYPIPYQPTSFISSIGQDLLTAGDSNGWYIAQAFSWASYPDTASGLGFNLGSARAPSAAEMVGMAALALNSGARNILFYSYFDIASNPAQLSALRQAITSLR